MKRCALYTTVYPGMESYFADWARSVDGQTDPGFDLWIGVDQLSTAAIDKAAQRHLSAEFVFAEHGDTPAIVRSRAMEKMVSRYDAVIFVDSDDVLAPKRVEEAKRYLLKYDVAGTALELIDQKGALLGITFSPPVSDYTSILFRWNPFGLSNTAYRTEILRKCLPIPADCVAVDWLLATRASLMGARLGFDPTPRMYYRQHPDNTARLLPPFTPGGVLNSTRIVLQHQRCLIGMNCVFDDNRKELLDNANSYVTRFFQSVSRNPGTLDRYVAALNILSLKPLWWTCVAHPDLEEIWNF
jgi:hypothetical protein